MKQNLKRIEATLHQLRSISTASYSKPTAMRKAHDWQKRNRTYSFEIRSAAQKPDLPTQRLHDDPQQMLSEGTLMSSTVSSPEKQSTYKEPILPKFNPPTFNSHHNGSNPALEMDLLKEPQTDVAACKSQIQQIVCQIQDIYHEGPIVDGWLESHPHAPEPSALTLRSELVDGRMEYVEEVCNFEQGKVTCESLRAGYRLCGFDAVGQKWSRPCPLEQLPSVSIAIARYKKLQQLLDRKQYLEIHLSQMQEHKNQNL